MIQSEIDKTIQDTIQYWEILARQIRQLSEDETVYTVSGTEFDPKETIDNCNNCSIENDFNGLETLDGAEFPLGLTTVVWTITDEANNECQCSFVVLINSLKPLVNKNRLLEFRF